MSRPRINGTLTTGLLTTWAVKLMRRNARYTKSTFDDLPTAVFWLRMAIAVLCGVVSGLAPLTGWSGFVVFGAAALGAVMLLLGPTWLDVDYDEWGFQELAGEGLMPSFGIFLVRYKWDCGKLAPVQHTPSPSLAARVDNTVHGFLLIASAARAWHARAASAPPAKIHGRRRPCRELAQGCCECAEPVLVVCHACRLNNCVSKATLGTKTTTLGRRKVLAQAAAKRCRR